MSGTILPVVTAIARLDEVSRRLATYRLNTTNTNDVNQLLRDAVKDIDSACKLLDQVKR